MQQGLRDFSRRPCNYGFVVLIYPAIGLALFTWASGGNAVQLLFPMVTGFALLGPFAIIGLYEMSRRLEKILIHLGHMFSTFLSLLLCPKLRCLRYVAWAISALSRHRAIAVLVALCRPAASIDS